jgi:nucleoid DNA-binding protein
MSNKDLTINQIIDLLQSGKNVTIPGFGSFKVKDMPERSYPDMRNAGQKITVAAHKALKFKSTLPL